MNIVDNIPDKCYPISSVEVDVELAIASIQKSLLKMGLSLEFFRDELKKSNICTMNLTYIPGMTGTDRWRKYRADHVVLDSLSISEKDFTENLDEFSGSYIYDIMDEIRERHFEKYGTRFVGRCQLIWSTTGHSYKIHRDMHTKHRYHVPLWTDSRVLWMFEDSDEDIQLLHMPADGRVWYLDPVSIKHTIVHAGTSPRMHILMTSQD